MPDRLDSVYFAAPIFFHLPCGARAAMGEGNFFVMNEPSEGYRLATLFSIAHRECRNDQECYPSRQFGHHRA